LRAPCVANEIGKSCRKNIDFSRRIQDM
jgi:hypothetical protein